MKFYIILLFSGIDIDSVNVLEEVQVEVVVSTEQVLVDALHILIADLHKLVVVQYKMAEEVKQLAVVVEA